MDKLIAGLLIAAVMLGASSVVLADQACYLVSKPKPTQLYPERVVNCTCTFPEDCGVRICADNLSQASHACDAANQPCYLASKPKPRQLYPLRVANCVCDFPEDCGVRICTANLVKAERLCDVSPSR